MNASGSPIDSAPAWIRLGLATLLSTIGGVGMWSVVVVLPAVQAEFGVARGEASLPYTLTMIGFAFGGVLMGRLADRFGVLVPLLIGAERARRRLYRRGLCREPVGVRDHARAADRHVRQLGHVRPLARGHLALVRSPAGHRGRDLRVGQLPGRGDLAARRAAFHRDPGLAADLHRRRAVLCADDASARLACSGVVRPVQQPSPGSPAGEPGQSPALGLSPGVLQALLVVAGLACCVAMSMPQVHIVAYCADLGYGVARGAEMLSLMLAFGIVSRVASGFIADRIGGLRTLLLGSVLQGVALLLYFLFDGLASLYVISALFGLFQGGIVPSYAIIVREYFPPREAGARVGLVIMATLFGMALGGWGSGVIFDLTGSYQAAFANGLLWNLLNVSIAVYLLQCSPPRLAVV